VSLETASIFLNGSYPQEHLEFYRRAVADCAGRRLLIAADGGLELFDRIERRPDLIVGDFDSVKSETLERFSAIETLRYPRDKDATDGELALRAAIDRGCFAVDLYGAIDTRFESDQMLANLLLLKGARRLAGASAVHVSARAVDHRQHIYYLENEQLRLSGKAGDFLSIIPLSEKIVVSETGVEWELDRREALMGSSWTLRNRFKQPNATVTIEGAALVVHRHTA
jgi:thiamine pyrophosphokinase